MQGLLEKVTACTRCGSERLMSVTAKCSDMCGVTLDNHDLDGYVPHGLNIGGGDYIEFQVCVVCGQMQGTWNLPLNILENTE